MTDLTNEPSHNPDAERCVLGSLMLDDALLADPLCGLVAADFHSDRHRTIYAACRRLHEAGKAVDLETIGNALAVAGTLDAAGGLAYLDEALASVPHPGHARTYAADVREHTRRRETGYAVREAGTLDPLILAEKARAVDERFPPLGSPRPAGGVVARRLCDVAAEPVEWLWEGRVAVGKMTLFAGEPDRGKSFVTVDVAARVTTGATWPDGRGRARRGRS